MQETQLEATRDAQTLRVELFIARLLRWGVILSFIILLAGIGSVLVTGNTGYHAIRLDDLDSIVAYHVRPDFPNTPSDVAQGVLVFKPYAIITLGLLVLIAIPVMRVVVSVIAFVTERDWLYVAITAWVLTVLLISFLIGEAGG
ncbi:MAG: DUF1634 domain-containing protein [Chloroflexi bacterium]|nr:DUF1634 domain-containing protein [Chloroflexota bacterium]